MTSELNDPDQLVPVLKLEPKGLGNPVVFRLDKLDERRAACEEILSHMDNIEAGDQVILTADKMTVGCLAALGEHTGW